MKFELIALDVDGTLLDDEHRLSDVTRESLLRVHELGVELVLCTGRGPNNTLPLLKDLGIEGTVITHNGAATVQSGDLRVVDQFSFHINDVSPLIQYCRQEGIHFDLCTVFDLFVENADKNVLSMYYKFGISPIYRKDLTQFDESLVKFTMFGDQQVMDHIEKDWAQFGCPLCVIRSGDQFIDIMHPVVNKGHALSRLAEMKQIDRDHILAIGNFYNDIEMLQFAGLGIAMGNSPEAVKESANAVTDTNNAHGVYKALEQFILLR